MSNFAKIKTHKYIPVKFAASTIRCPECDGIFTHQESVTADWRFNEGGDGLRTTSSNGYINTSYTSAEDIEGSRDNIYIKIRCEENHFAILHIYQQKGHTIFAWK